MARRLLVVLLVATAALIFPSGATLTATDALLPPSSLVDALEAYSDGRSLRVEFKTIEDLRYALNRSGRDWAESGPVDDRRRRRNVVALFALDAVLNSPPLGSTVALLEWACDYLRAGEPSEFEHSWMLASIAYAQSQRREDFLVDDACGSVQSGSPCLHVRHARSRFPDERRFAVGNVFGRTEVNVLTRRPVLSPTQLVRARTWLSPNPPAAPSSFDTERIADTLGRLQELTTDTVVGSIAQLRIGILHYELRRQSDSRRVLTELLEGTPDRYLRNFAHLIMGLGFASEERQADAEREFAAAVAADSGVVSSAMELAALYFSSGRRDQGSALLDRALSAAPQDDPWQYPCPDCGGWTKRIENLHAWVRR